MSEKTPFNVNDVVLVKLNDLGRQILKDNHKALDIRSLHRPPVEDAEGYSRWQLWDLMSRFGSSISLGGQMPFDTQILFEVKT